MTKPILVLGYGNPSRGDDALGPLLLDFVDRQFDLARIDLLTDFQLQIEYALDLQGRELVLFVDASVACSEAFDFAELQPARDNSYTSHAMSPAAVLQVYQSITGQFPPPSFLLSIQGLSFELGAGLSDEAADNLQQACQFAGRLLSHSAADAWRQALSQKHTVIC
ncbi:MAG: hydrogenase maturation protease [Methylococcaceae bacterium]|nr:hydrogenase maturation protease [Methylococcaceae bacterium]